MTTTNNLNIGLVEQSQAQKEVTINAAICAQEALRNRGIEDKDLTTPPAEPNEGDAYIVAATATDDWLGHEDDITYFNNSSWSFVTPNEGLLMWVKDEDKLYYFDGSAWAIYGAGLEDPEMLGINATADTTNRLSVASDAVLFNHNGDDIRAKLNKSTESDIASFLFQTDFEGRAEFGLIGDDDFTLKVSDDGSAFTTSFAVDKSSGEVEFMQGINFGDDSFEYYEEGVFTPEFFGVTVTYEIGNVGTYIRIGNRVFIDATIDYSSLDTGDDSVVAIQKSCLPFEPAYAGLIAINRHGSTGLNLAANDSIYLDMNSSGSFLYFRDAARDTYEYDDGSILATGKFAFSGSYTIL